MRWLQSQNIRSRRCTNQVAQAYVEVRDNHLASGSFRCALALLSLVCLACEKADDTLIDSAGLAPTIAAILISPSRINTDSIDVGAERKPEDILPIRVKTYAAVSMPGGTGAQVSVRANVLREIGGSVLAGSELYDNGAGVDSTRGDGIFSGTVEFNLKRSEVGKYRLEMYAQDSNGFQSNSGILMLHVVRANRPPILSDLRAPDSVWISRQTSFLITVRATDPDGQSDIRSVTRTTPSNLVLQLNDSGVNGDAVAGDGVYSELVSLSPPPAPGSYQFRFQAFDRSNAVSNTILHTIVVMP